MDFLERAVTPGSGGGEEWGLKILPSHVAGQGSPALTSVELSEVDGRGDATWTDPLRAGSTFVMGY